jgi:hypothetical protein
MLCRPISFERASGCERRKSRAGLRGLFPIAWAAPAIVRCSLSILGGGYEQRGRTKFGALLNARLSTSWPWLPHRVPEAIATVHYSSNFRGVAPTWNYWVADCHRVDARTVWAGVRPHRNLSNIGGIRSGKQPAGDAMRLRGEVQLGSRLSGLPTDGCRLMRPEDSVCRLTAPLHTLARCDGRPDEPETPSSWPSA